MMKNTYKTSVGVIAHHKDYLKATETLDSISYNLVNPDSDIFK
jgi:hypothetical protein